MILSLSFLDMNCFRKRKKGEKEATQRGNPGKGLPLHFTRRSTEKHPPPAYSTLGDKPFLFYDLLSLRAEQKLNVLGSRPLRLPVRKHEQRPRNRILSGKGRLRGRLNASNLQTLNGLIKVADPDVPDGVFILRDGLDNGPVGGLQLGPGVTFALWRTFCSHVSYVPELVSREITTIFYPPLRPLSSW